MSPPRTSMSRARRSMPGSSMSCGSSRGRRRRPRGGRCSGLQLGTPKMSGKNLTLFTRQLATLNRRVATGGKPAHDHPPDRAGKRPADRGAGACGRRRRPPPRRFDGARTQKLSAALSRDGGGGGEFGDAADDPWDRLAALLERQAEIRGQADHRARLSLHPGNRGAWGRDCADDVRGAAGRRAIRYRRAAIAVPDAYGYRVK